MSMLDVKQYYVDLRDQYLEMKEMYDKVEEEYKNGKVDQEYYDRVTEFKNSEENNFFRVSYIMDLLAKPKSQKNKKKFGQLIEFLDERYEYVNADKKCVIDENSYLLNEVHQILAELGIEVDE